MKKILLILCIILGESSLFAHFYPKYPETLPTKLREFPASSVNVRRFTLNFIPCTIQPVGLLECSLHWDTRQVFGFRDAIIALFPLPKNCGVLKEDINDQGLFHITAASSIFGLVISGPPVSPQMAAIIGCDFLGNRENFANSMRFFYAFARILWELDAFFFGTLWHPLLIPSCFPQTVSFTFGSPIEPRARCPQLRYTHTFGSMEFALTAASQSLFASPGPIGVTPEYIRNSVMPNFNIQLRKNISEHQVGIALDYKRLVPRLVTDKNIKVSEKIDSFIVQSWAALNFERSSLRMKFVYAQNAADQVMISGYGVHCIDKVNDFRTYTPITCYAAWIDASYVLIHLRSEVGIFGGITKNLGADKSLARDPITNLPIAYYFAPIVQNLDFVWRIAPRYVWIKDPIRVGLEIDICRAAFGKPDNFARIRNSVPVTNVRLYFSLFYSF